MAEGLCIDTTHHARVADTIRPEARGIVRQLHAAGIAQVIMLTGDNRITAEAIAREVGVDEVHAELLPEDKVKKVEDFIGRYSTVAMVGDGVNDAPALDLGIAMGAIGSDAAIETADIVLMTDDIFKLPWLVAIPGGRFLLSARTSRLLLS